MTHARTDRPRCGRCNRPCSARALVATKLGPRCKWCARTLPRGLYCQPRGAR